MAQGLPGYPSNAKLNQQAAQLAHGAVPTRRSIRRQYALPIQANRGFTEALIHLLQGGGGAVSSGYDSAITNQQAFDQAAASRLAGLGGPDAAGSAAAVAGLGGSALSSLNAQAAAAKNYAGQLPAVAASRGQLMNAQLLQQRNQALTQRNEDYRSALQQALQNVQQNALAMSSLRSSNMNAAADRALQLQSMAQSNAQFQQEQARLNKEFAFEHSPKWLAMQAQIQAAANGNSAGAGPLAQYTPGQIAGFQKQASGTLNDPATGLLSGGGQSPGQAIRNLQAAGIPRQIAMAEAINAYRNLTPPPAAFKKTHPAQYRAAFAAYTKTVRGFRTWLATKAWKKKHPGGAPSSNQPVSFGGGPH